MCTLEQTQADLHSLLCCLWMTANKDKVGHFTNQSHLSFTDYICPNTVTCRLCKLVNDKNQCVVCLYTLNTASQKNCSHFD